MYFTAISKCVNGAISQDHRDNLDEDMLYWLATAEAIATGVLYAGMRRGLPYKEIYQKLKQEVSAFGDKVNETIFEIEQAA